MSRELAITIGVHIEDTTRATASARVVTIKSDAFSSVSLFCADEQQARAIADAINAKPMQLAEAAE